MPTVDGTKIVYYVVDILRLTPPPALILMAYYVCVALRLSADRHEQKAHILLWPATTIVIEQSWVLWNNRHRYNSILRPVCSSD